MPYLIFSQYSIQGKNLISNNSEAKIVLEYIPSLDELYSVNSEHIITSATIDSSGSFRLTGTDLPDETKLYRLSFSQSKNGLGMTNGITKSFINIAINNQTLLSLNSCKINNDFSFCHLSGSTESKVIQVIYDGIFKNLQKETIKQYSENNTISDTKKRLLDEKYTRDLMHFADTTMYLHAGLVALGHLRNLEEIYKIQPEFFHNYLSKWRNRTENNEYYVQLKTEIDFLHSVHFPDSKSRLNWKMWFALALLVNLLLAGYIIYLKKQISRLEPDFQKNNTPTIDRLSPKEKEVYELLCKGLSNKEIGLNLFIETNTVKSHTAKIYRKLNVNSRDELIKTSK